jgi:pimeloyl-ACP methyl ester carboxylesterase
MRSLSTQKFQVFDGLISATFADGPRRPVVFLHGNSSTKTVWAKQLHAVHRQGHAILAPDLPGHGASENSRSPEHTYSLPGYAAIIGALLDVFEWQSIDLIGWSLGGHIGLQLLAADPRINSLLIVGAPPAPLSTESLRAAFYPSAPMDLASSLEFTRDDALAYGRAMMGGDEHLTAELLSSISRTDGVARAHFFASALRGEGVDQKKTVETTDKSLCIVHGECDPFVRLHYLRSVHYRALWRDEIFVIPDAGHAPHWQRPTAFNSILLDFLARSEI